MGELVDGQWLTEAELDADETDGEYERSETTFRESIDTDADARFTAERNRYHLYVSYACPWAHRTLVTRALMGLEDAISVDVVDPLRIDEGWEFTPDKPGCTPDTIHGSDYLREVYLEADPEFSGRVTVPVLWDTQEGTIVNNESEEIIKMLADSFGSFTTRDVDLYPEHHRATIDEVIDDIYPSINNGVYRAGFATSQAAYEDAVTELFAALDRYDSILGDQRFVAGDRLTLADVCMFTTLYRFDEAYHTHFKCNRHRVSDYENLWPYLRELYQLPGVPRTCKMDHVKEHYYGSHDSLNPSGIVPIGPQPTFDAPHDRDRLPGGPPAALRAMSAGD